MIENVTGCDKHDCVFDHLCKKTVGKIYEGKFVCDEYRNLEMFLDELVAKNMEVGKNE